MQRAESLSRNGQLSSGFSRADMRDVITDEIGDCFALELTSGEGADAIIRRCGLWELYEIAEKISRSGFGISTEHRRELGEALARVRGEAD